MSIPSTMKAFVATGYGAIEERLQLRTDVPTPTLSSDDDDDDDDCMIVRVLCCALAPGDPRVLSGKTDHVQKPKGGFPYIAGSDTAGIVVAVSKTQTKFQVGDYVVSRFELPGPSGGLAEYRKVKTSLSEKCPKSIAPELACGLTASAVAAKKLVRDAAAIREGDRVLVIGGSGGVGTSVLQYAKLAKPSLLVAVSTQTDLCRRLGADQVVDYRTNKWWEMPEFHKDRFNVVIDLVNGDNWTKGGCSGKAVDRKGIYVGLVPGVATEIVVHGQWDILKLMVLMMWRFVIYPRLFPSIPKYTFPQTLEDVKDREFMEVLDDVVEGRLKPILDSECPLDFTEAGCQRAFQLQKSCHAHGKVVVKISDSAAQ